VKAVGIFGELPLGGEYTKAPILRRYVRISDCDIWAAAVQS